MAVALLVMLVGATVSCVSGLNNTQCGQTLFTDSSGYISSPNYPNSYPTGTYCNYEIKRPGQWVRITWSTTFDIKGKMPYCHDDFVEVFIGCGSYKTVSRFCSRNAGKPHPIYARDGCVKIRFFALSTSDTGKGFELRYESRSLSQAYSTERCSSDRNVYVDSATIFSPGWPTGYKRSMLAFLGECEWDIKLSSNKRVKVNVMDMDLHATTGCYGFSDSVKVKGYFVGSLPNIINRNIATSGSFHEQYTEEKCVTINC